MKVALRPLPEKLAGPVIVNVAAAKLVVTEIAPVLGGVASTLSPPGSLPCCKIRVCNNHIL